MAQPAIFLKPIPSLFSQVVAMKAKSPCISFSLLLSASLASGMLNWITEPFNRLSQAFAPTPPHEIEPRHKQTFSYGGMNVFSYDDRMFASIQHEQSGPIYLAIQTQNVDVGVYSFMAMFAPPKFDRQDESYSSMVNDKVAAGISRKKAKKAAKKVVQKVTDTPGPIAEFLIVDQNIHGETLRPYKEDIALGKQRLLYARQRYSDSLDNAEESLRHSGKLPRRVVLEVVDQKANAERMLNSIDKRLASNVQLLHMTQGFEFVKFHANRDFRISESLLQRLDAIYIYKAGKTSAWMDQDLVVQLVLIRVGDELVPVNPFDENTEQGGSSSHS